MCICVNRVYARSCASVSAEARVCARDMRLCTCARGGTVLYLTIVVSVCLSVHQRRLLVCACVVEFGRF